MSSEWQTASRSFERAEASAGECAREFDALQDSLVEQADAWDRLADAFGGGRDG